MEELKRIIKNQREENIRLTEQVREEVHATVDERIDDRMEMRLQQITDQMVTKRTTYQTGYTRDTHYQGSDSTEIDNTNNGKWRNISKPKVRQIMDATTPPRNKVMKYDDRDSNTPMEGQSPT
jgi:hypothetical protein